ncbi:hypothetical protein [uncultured Campylobacter sp.]|uniref:hypothetical protein n=1 Tax=uncultured Campylobacter sp. TaxID=218934 RepID=UPI0026147B92|nr:hypothetical protein [uncultured Campylobacter sp.]
MRLCCAAHGKKSGLRRLNLGGAINLKSLRPVKTKRTIRRQNFIDWACFGFTRD